MLQTDHRDIDLNRAPLEGRGAVDPSSFGEFVLESSLIVGVDLTGLAAGVHSFPQCDIALNVDESFLAFQALVSRPEGCDVLEGFFVRGAESGAVAGYRARSDGGLRSLPRCFTDLVRHRAGSVPSFAQLVAAFSAQEVVVFEHSAREQDLAEEVKYLHEHLAQHKDAIKDLKGALRLATLTDAAGGESDVDRGPSGFMSADEGISLDSLPLWCAEHEDQIVVLPRARNGIKKSKYEDQPLLGKALSMLAGPYRQMRAGEITRAQLDLLLAEAGLKLSGSTAPSVAGEQGDSYFVVWRGRRRFMDSHLVKGGGRDERYCFRCYFFWDEESQRVVVGHMPSHLNNSLS